MIVELINTSTVRIAYIHGLTNYILHRSGGEWRMDGLFIAEGRQTREEAIRLATRMIEAWRGTA